MTDYNRMTIYADEGFEEEVKSHAEDQDQTMSEFVRETLKRRMYNDEFKNISQEAQVEQRILELMDEARTTIQRTSDDIEGPLEEILVYVIALWEISSDEVGDVKRKNALETARARAGLAKSETGPDDSSKKDGRSNDTDSAENAADQPDQTSAQQAGESDSKKGETTVGDVDFDEEWSHEY